MKKRTNEEVALFMIENGCELLCPYSNDRIPVVFRCQCGNEAKVIFSKFKQGRRCKQCGKQENSAKRKIDYEEVKKCFSNEGCLLLSKRYVQIHDLMDYICNCGHQSQISLNNFKAGHRCKNCVDLTGINNPRWNPDRGAVNVSFLIRKKCYNMLRITLLATGKKKNGKTKNTLGYSPAELNRWLASQPDWAEVQKTDWHLDHTFPIKAFLDYGISDLKIINCLKNLRAVSKIFNLQKNAKYSKEDFELWMKNNYPQLKMARDCSLAIQ